MDRKMKFNVTLDFEHGDGSDVCVSTEVSDEEYELLKNCYRLGEDIGDCEELTNLFEEIKKTALKENHSRLANSDPGKEIDYDEICYFIEFPDEIVEVVENEESDEDGEIDLNDYCDYPFAMEVVNGEIVSLTEDFQKKIKESLMETLDMTQDELILCLKGMSDDDSEEYELLDSCGYDALSEILGYDEIKEEFIPEGIGLFESPYGWEAKELLESLGFALKENVKYGPHGHGTNGVVFMEEI